MIQSLVRGVTMIPAAMARVLDDVRQSRSLSHFRGKVRRFYLVTFRKSHVRRQIARRRGACRQCGRCCTLCVTCVFLSEQGRCAVYGRWRHATCIAFPIDGRDVADIERGGGRCGYYFADAAAGAAAAPQAGAASGLQTP